jgi:pyruvate dehydrogenase (quinone)
MDLAVLGDVGETVRALLPLVERAKSRQFLDSMVGRHTRAMSGVVGAHTKDVQRHTPIHPEYGAVTLDEEACQDAVFTVDTGMCNVWAARYITAGFTIAMSKEILGCGMGEVMAMAGSNLPNVPRP